MKRILLLVSVCLSAGACTSKTSTAIKTENPVIESIMARRSVRHYTDTPVGRDTLQLLAKCGVNAPNAMNKQEWEVRIVDDSAYFNGVTKLMKTSMPFAVNTNDPKFRNGFRNCTAAFFIACPEDEAGMLLQNVGLMSENICLAAQSLGLGTCIMGSPAMFLNNTPEAKPYLDKLDFSEGYVLRVVIAVGHPDEQPDAKPRNLSKVKFVE